MAILGEERILLTYLTTGFLFNKYHFFHSVQLNVNNRSVERKIYVSFLAGVIVQ